MCLDEKVNNKISIIGIIIIEILYNEEDESKIRMILISVNNIIIEVIGSIIIVESNIEYFILNLINIYNTIKGIILIYIIRGFIVSINNIIENEGIINFIRS